MHVSELARVCSTVIEEESKEPGELVEWPVEPWSKLEFVDEDENDDDTAGGFEP